MIPQKTKLEIIEQLFDNYYVKDPSKRAYGRYACKYYDKDTGNKCAVGMCMLDDHTAKLYNQYGGVGAIVRDLENKSSKLDDILKKEYHGHDKYFWGAMQNMHDEGDYWTDKGLSEDGSNKLSEIKVMYS